MKRTRIERLIGITLLLVLIVILYAFNGFHLPIASWK